MAKNTQQTSAKVVLVRVAQFLIAMVVYRWGIFQILPIHSYANAYSQLAPIDGTLPSVLLANLTQAWSIVSLAFQGAPGVVYSALLIVSIVGTIVYYRRYQKLNNTPLVLLAVVAAVFLSIVGIQITSAAPNYLGRTLMGFAALLFVPILGLAIYAPTKFYMGLTGAIAAFALVTNVVATNATRNDLAFQRSIGTRIIADIDRMGLSTAPHLVIDGVAPMSPVASRAWDVYPVIRPALMSLFNHGYDGGRFLLFELGFGYVTYHPNREVILQQISQTDPSTENNFYKAYNIDGTPVISFHN